MSAPTTAVRALVFDWMTAFATTDELSDEAREDLPRRIEALVAAERLAAQAAQRAADAAICDAHVAPIPGRADDKPPCYFAMDHECATELAAALRASGPPAVEPERGLALADLRIGLALEADRGDLPDATRQLLRRAHAALAAPPGWVAVAAVRALLEAERWCPLNATASVTDNLLARLEALTDAPGAGAPAAAAAPPAGRSR